MAEDASFGHWLGYRRRILDLTQEELARQVGYSVSAIRKIEADALRPSREMAERLADVLQVPSEQRPRFVRAARGLTPDGPQPDLGAQAHSTAEPPPRHNLPAPRTSFVGRTEEIAELERLLASARLVTVTGSGGVGKSTLALRVAADLVERYPDGAWLVELASLTNPDLVPSTVAGVLGIREPPGQPILDALLASLSLRHCLLLLDNCEHLIEACRRLADSILRSCPGVTLLATSREPLRVAGETAWRLESLAVPPLGQTDEPRQADQLDRVGRLESYEAVQLFVARAKAVQPGFSLTPDNGLAVAETCRRLDGIPLALELAAARVTVLTPQQIANRLDDRFHLLTAGSRTALPRHQTMRAAIDWSHDLLTAGEQTLFRRLAVFAGTFTLEAAETIGTGGGIQARAILDLLSGLVDKSLVVAEVSSGEALYRMLETVREYALEELAGSGEDNAVRECHLSWYIALARRAEPELHGPHSAFWLDRLEAEHDNFRAALAWSLEHDVQSGLELVASLCWFWDHRCHFREGWSWATRLLAKSSEESISRAKALRTAGYMADGLRNFASSTRLYRESLSLARRLGNRREHGITALWAGRAQAFRSPDSGAGTELFEEALAAGREVGEDWLVANALASLGMVALGLGETDRGRQLLEESLTLNRESGSRLGVAVKLWLLGHVAIHEGDLPQARVRLAESLAIRREVGGAYVISASLSSLGCIAVLERDLAEAKELLSESLAVACQLGGNPTADSRNVWLAGLIAVASEEFGPGVRLLGALDSECRRTLTTVDPLLFLHVESALAAAQGALGGNAFDRAWAEGQAMSLEQAVEYALQSE